MKVTSVKTVAILESFSQHEFKCRKRRCYQNSNLTKISKIKIRRLHKQAVCRNKSENIFSCCTCLPKRKKK